MAKETENSMEKKAGAFRELAASYTTPMRSQPDKLEPFREGIIAMRRKKAPYPAIVDALKAVGVEVSVDAVGQYCRERINKRKSHRPSAKQGQKNSDSKAPGKSTHHIAINEDERPSTEEPFSSPQENSGDSNG